MPEIFDVPEPDRRFYVIHLDFDALESGDYAECGMLPLAEYELRGIMRTLGLYATTVIGGGASPLYLVVRIK